MLSRRQLRSKCLQALYAFSQSNNSNLAAGEKELLHSVDKVYDLYLLQLSLIIEIVDYASVKSEEAKHKRLPTADDLNPNNKFIENRLIAKLRINKKLHRELANRKLSWAGETEFLKKIYTEIKSSADYLNYMNSGTDSFLEDKEFIVKLYKSLIAGSEAIEQYFEEKSIYWLDDIELVDSMVVKTYKTFSVTSDEDQPLMKLYNNEEEDKQYVIDLFRKTILHGDEYEKIIDEKTKNWEIERIALMDIIIMKMAICELLNFPTIPVKVTLNEFIDISKRFSTPKSKIFVNGVLDKIIADFKAKDKIKKTGRGLID